MMQSIRMKFLSHFFYKKTEVIKMRIEHKKGYTAAIECGSLLHKRMLLSFLIEGDLLKNLQLHCIT